MRTFPLPSKTGTWLSILYVCLLISSAPALAQIDRPHEAPLAERIKTRIMAQSNGDGFVCRGEPICGIRLLPLFYMDNDYRPAWSDETGLRASVRRLLQAIEDAKDDGLRPSDYHLEAIRHIIAQIENPPRLSPDQWVEAWADMDLLLSDAFLLLGSHLSAGRVNPETLHNDWLVSERSVDLMAALKKMVAAPEDRNQTVIEGLRPAHPDYRDLRNALSRLRRLAGSGGWPEIPANDTLRPGDHHPTMVPLRQRLTLSGDLPEKSNPEDPQLFDENLKAAVTAFQKRHGLETDGVVGRDTFSALNVSVQHRIRQAELNLERWRWLPNDLGERYILVNTADFHLTAVENGAAAMDMRVVVGRPARRSPVFSSRITYLVLNPYWNVPTSIAVKDILPRLQKSPDYLLQQGFKVFNGWSDNTPEINPGVIDWSLYSEHYFPFRLRQEPGSANALGRIKFMFPNKFDVYLHDTPQRSHFDKAQRDFSSGCIRVEDAIGLAAYLLGNDPRWSPASIREALAKSSNRVVHLKDPVIIHLLYMTAWATADGRVHFRKDIYGRDETLDKALERRPPETPAFRPLSPREPEPIALLRLGI